MIRDDRCLSAFGKKVIDNRTESTNSVSRARQQVFQALKAIWSVL